MKSGPESFPNLEMALKNPGRLLIATDFDGTLCPLADEPSSVYPEPSTLATLGRLALNPRLTLSVISGRALSDLRERMPLDVVLAGNHGLEIEGGGLHFSHPGAHRLRGSLAGAARRLETLRRRWPGARIEDKGLSLTVHFRQVDRAQHRAIVLAARYCLDVFGPRLVYRNGIDSLEVRPNIDWEKGNAFLQIREELGPFQTCICLGDDQTDESMFHANPGGLNFHVGRLKETAANSTLSGPREVVAVLAEIAAASEVRLAAGFASSCEQKAFTAANQDRA